jgi:oxygen-dependent protoporphyrinogen oxidase
MLSQVPQDALLILLRQCYVRRSCRGSPRLVHQTTRPRLRSQKTSIRTLTSAPSSRNYDFVNDRSLRVPSGALNGICAGSARSFHISVRALSSDTNSKKTLDIAVLGGGITGLSTAYHLAKKLDANITLYEASDRLGGWLESKSVDVEDGTVLFEQGPRTLRPMGTVAGLATLELVKMLGLEHEMLITPKDAISARNRYIYYPDHLAKLPGPGDTLFEILWKMFTEPVLAGMVPAVIRDYRNTGRPENIEDESMGDFLTRRLGSPQLGDNMVSAVLHGIYAGNLYQLSVKSLFPWLWHTELEYGGWTRASMWLMSNKQYVTTQREYDLREDMHPTVSKMERFEELANASVYSFEGGIQTLSDALVHDVEGNPRVTVKKGTPIEHMAMNDARTSVQVYFTIFDQWFYALTPTDNNVRPLLRARALRQSHLYPAGQNPRLPDPSPHHRPHILLRVPPPFPHKHPRRNRHGRQPLLPKQEPPPRPWLWLPHPSFHPLRAEPRARARRHLRLGLSC